jgi:hypothetical protein
MPGRHGATPKDLLAPRGRKLTLSFDGLEALFVSDRAPGLGGSDLWSSSRPGLDSPFSSPTNLGEGNSPAADLDVTLSANGLELVFSSSRDGTFELWHAERQCL